MFLSTAFDIRLFGTLLLVANKYHGYEALSRIQPCHESFYYPSMNLAVTSAFVVYPGVAPMLTLK